MGVEHRDYMQDSSGPGLSGELRLMAVSHQLVILNAVVFILSYVPGLDALLAAHFMVSWQSVFVDFHVWTLVTAAFHHAGLWHLLWNMLFLHWFGPDLEAIYGRANFLLLYLWAAVVSSLTYVVWSHGWGDGLPMLGASGAVMAVVLVSALFFPQRTILLFLVLPIPLWALAALKLAGDTLGLGAGGDGVAHAAHLGGAAAGAAFKLLDLRLFAGPGDPGAWRWPWHSEPGAKLPRRRARPAPNRSGSERVDAETGDRVDDLLRKISREGMDSLSEEELAFLKQASGRYKRPS